MNKSSEPLIIAHRGESIDAPENTLAAINLAWERKVGAVEIDIQFTSDNQIVVFHDLETSRICGVKKVIRHSTLGELKLLDAGSYKDEEWKSERIPTLKEVLQTVPADGKLIIEIKSNAAILNVLKQELSDSGLQNTQIEIIAFDLDTLAKAKELMPEYIMLWLLDLDYQWPWWMLCLNKRKIIRKIEKLKLDGVDVWAGKILNDKFISEFHKAGLLVYSWTVDDPEKAKYLQEHGIDGITTNKAAWITDQLKK